MELKCIYKIQQAAYAETLNRTSVELKYKTVRAISTNQTPLNRTSVELKSHFLDARLFG